MKKNKAFFTVFLIVICICAMTTTAFAGTSPVGGGIGVGDSPNGGGIGIDDSPNGGGVGIDHSSGDWTISDFFGSGIPKGLLIVKNPLSAEDALILTNAIQSAIQSRHFTGQYQQFMIDLSLTLDGQPYDQQGKAITFKMIYSGIKPWDKALIVHIKHDGTVELVDAICETDSITFTLTSLSPIALLVMKGTETVDSSATTTTVLSPKTNETDKTIPIWLIAAALIGIASIGVFRRIIKKG